MMRIKVNAVEGGEPKTFLTPEDAWRYVKDVLKEPAVVSTFPEGGGNVVAFLKDGMNKKAERRIVVTSSITNEYLKIYTAEN